nr:MAG TPA: hypothetical protein [Caudoviricetes sp.]
MEAFPYLHSVDVISYVLAKNNSKWRSWEFCRSYEFVSAIKINNFIKDQKIRQ